MLKNQAIIPESKDVEEEQVFEFDRELSGYFVQVPVELIRGNLLSPAALKLYMVLLSYCGRGNQAWPGQERLARDMALTGRRVRSLLTELQGAGLLTVSHRNGTSNLYHLHRLNTRAAKAGMEEDFQPYRKNSSSTTGKARQNLSPESHEILESEKPESHVPRVETKRIKTGPAIHAEKKEAMAAFREELAISPKKKNDSANPPVSPEKSKLLEKLGKIGISGPTVVSLLTAALHNDRDQQYLESLAEWVETRKGIANPGAYLATLVRLNVDPRTLQQKEISSMPHNSKGCVIDWSKYSSGGKYAYLTRALCD